MAGQIGHESVQEAMEKVAEAARAAGKFWGTVAVGPELYARAVKLGAQFLCPGGDLKVMNFGLRELAKTLSAANAADTAASSSNTASTTNYA